MASEKTAWRGHAEVLEWLKAEGCAVVGTGRAAKDVQFWLPKSGCLAAIQWLHANDPAHVMTAHFFQECAAGKKGPPKGRSQRLLPVCRC
eukprot:SAG22_NODE_1084_length_5637_cov_2.170820_2_plen_90_part_00